MAAWPLAVPLFSYSCMSEQKEIVRWMVDTGAQERARAESHLGDLRERMRMYLADVQNLENEIKATEKAVEKLKQDEVTGLPKRIAASEEAYAQLMRHSAVESIEVSGSNLLIKTKLLFTDIRTSEGSRKTRRSCIGAFEVKIAPGQLRVGVVNQLFTDHWAIRSGVPCLGEYSEDIETSIATQRWYQFFDTLYHFLRNAADDAAAYSSSHVWRQHNRKKSTLGYFVEPERPPKKFAAGDTVICLEDTYESAEGLEGLTARVLDGGRNPEEQHVEFRRAMRGHSNCDGEDGHCWVIPTSYLAPITTAEYEAAEVYDPSFKKGRVIDQIDALPDGSTMADVKEIQEAVAKEERVLTLKIKKAAKAMAV